MKRLFALYVFAVTLLVPIGAYAEVPVVDSGGREFGENVMTRPVWLILLTLLTWGIVAAWKDPRLPGVLGERGKRLAPYLVSILVGVTEALMREQSWHAVMEGIQNGLIAAVSAAGLVQDGIVRGIFGKGTTPAAKTGTSVVTTIFMGALCLFLAAGCAGGAGQADRALESITTSIRPIDDKMREAYDREQAACSDAACLGKVREWWKPVIEAMQKIRDAWCSVKPDDADCKGGT